MCRAAQCSKCGKPTWKGCGAHVEQVLGHVPESQRCRCHEQGAAVPATASAGRRRRWFGW